MRLPDHADLEHSLLPELSQCPVAKVCPTGYPLGSRWRTQSSLSQSDGARQRLAALPAALCAGAQSEGNLWDEIREKIFRNYVLKSIDAVHRKLEEAILYIERNPKLVKSITSFPYIVKSL